MSPGFKNPCAHARAHRAHFSPDPRIPCSHALQPVLGTELVATASTVVDTLPAPSVTNSVTTVGAGVISGIALTFSTLTAAVGSAPAFAPKSGLYVLAPSSEASRRPGEAGTEVLKR